MLLQKIMNFGWKDTIFANPRVYSTFRVVSMGRCAFHYVCGGIMISRAGTSISCDWRKVNTVCATVMHCLVLVT